MDSKLKKFLTVVTLWQPKVISVSIWAVATYFRLARYFDKDWVKMIYEYFKMA